MEEEPRLQLKTINGRVLLSAPAGSKSFDLFTNLNGTVKDDFSEFDSLRTSKKPGACDCCMGQLYRLNWLARW